MPFQALLLQWMVLHTGRRKNYWREDLEGVHGFWKLVWSFSVSITLPEKFGTERVVVITWAGLNENAFGQGATNYYPKIKIWQIFWVFNLLFSIHREKQKCTKATTAKPMKIDFFEQVQTFEKNLPDWSSLEFADTETTTDDMTTFSSTINPEFMKVVKERRWKKHNMIGETYYEIIQSLRCYGGDLLFPYLIIN